MQNKKAQEKAQEIEEIKITIKIIEDCVKVKDINGVDTLFKNLGSTVAKEVFIAICEEFEKKNSIKEINQFFDLNNIPARSKARIFNQIKDLICDNKKHIIGMLAIRKIELAEAEEALKKMTNLGPENPGSHDGANGHNDDNLEILRICPSQDNFDEWEEKIPEQCFAQELHGFEINKEFIEYVAKEVLNCSEEEALHKILEATELEANKGIGANYSGPRP